MEEEFSTEEKIKIAAKKVFTEKGLAGARMQDIADAAEINKAMLHYYFRSKQKLFDMIFEEKLRELFSTMSDILDSDKPLKVKVEEFVKRESDIMAEFPSLPLFILTEAWQSPLEVEKTISNQRLDNVRSKFKKLYRQSVSAPIQKIIPFEQFMINMVSLVIYPNIARPVLKPMLNISDTDFDRLMKQRKTLVAQLILQNIDLGHEM